MNIDGLLRMPSVMLFLTLAVYALAVQIRARTGNVLCNPVLISTLVLMGYLKVFAIDYELYHSASHFIDFWLNPIAIEITASIGGIPAITAATVIIAGLFGQMAGYKVLKGALYMPSSVGMSLGTASHAMGIAASLEYGRRMAAYAGLGLTLNGVLTAILVPILIPLLGV